MNTIVRDAQKTPITSGAKKSMKSVTLLVGGLSICFKVNKRALASRTYEIFSTNTTPTCHFEPNLFLPEFEPVFRDNQMQVVVGYSNEGKEVISHVESNPAVQCILIENLNTVKYYCAQEPFGRANNFFPTPPMLLLGVTHLLMEHGIFLHSMAGVYAGKGFAFCGTTNTGKSTIAQKWADKGVQVLGDERVILRYHGDDILVGGTPWPGSFEYVSNVTAPLTCLFLLRTSGLVLEPVRSAGKFLEWMMPLTYHQPWNPEFTAFILEFLNKLYQKVPIFWVNRSEVGDPRTFFQGVDLFCS